LGRLETVPEGAGRRDSNPAFFVLEEGKKEGKEGHLPGKTPLRRTVREGKRRQAPIVCNFPFGLDHLGLEPFPAL